MFAHSINPLKKNDVINLNTNKKKYRDKVLQISNVTTAMHWLFAQQQAHANNIQIIKSAGRYLYFCKIFLNSIFKRPYKLNCKYVIVFYLEMIPILSKQSVHISGQQTWRFCIIPLMSCDIAPKCSSHGMSQIGYDDADTQNLQHLDFITANNSENTHSMMIIYEVNIVLEKAISSWWNHICTSVAVNFLEVFFHQNSTLVIRPHSVIFLSDAMTHD